MQNIQQRGPSVNGIPIKVVYCHTCHRMQGEEYLDSIDPNTVIEVDYCSLCRKEEREKI